MSNSSTIKKMTVNEIRDFKKSLKTINPIQDGHFRCCSWMRGVKIPRIVPKLCHTHPTMMKLGTAISYLRKSKKMYASRDTLPDFC